MLLSLSLFHFKWWGLTDFFKLHCLNWFGSDFSVAILVRDINIPMRCVEVIGWFVKSFSRFGGVLFWSYSLLCKDLYRGVSTTSVDEASHLMNQLDFAQALRDIRETCKYLKQTEGYSKVGRRKKIIYLPSVYASWHELSILIWLRVVCLMSDLFGRIWLRRLPCISSRRSFEGYQWLDNNHLKMFVIQLTVAMTDCAILFVGSFGVSL